jgi:hypothetical protein
MGMDSSGITITFLASARHLSSTIQVGYRASLTYCKMSTWRAASMGAKQLGLEAEHSL